jgi:PRTRC genetic system protein B
MNPLSGWTGQLLQTALNEPPQAVLSFYSYGVLLRKALPNGTFTEYPVDVSQLAQALATKVRFDTGVLHENILLVRREGLRELVVGYRPPQKTGIWLEGSSEPLRVPLPGLILLRNVSGSTANYHLYAVKRRPTTLNAVLYHAPLPNVFGSGSICWGNVALPTPHDLELTPVWQHFWGTPFGNHGVGGKSRQYRQDIREHLLQLTHKRSYPSRDLLPVEKTLGQMTNWEAAYA